jgi:PKD repeat protein
LFKADCYAAFRINFQKNIKLNKFLVKIIIFGLTKKTPTMKKKLLLSLVLCSFFLSSQAQWVLQASGFATASRGIRYICAVDSNVVWAIGYDGSSSTAAQIQEFTRTTNGGNLWTAGAIPGYTGSGLSMVYAIDALNAWIPVWYANGGGTIIRTTNGGASWTPQPTATFASPNGFPNVVHFWDANEGFCMGDPNGGYFEIYTTIDGGITWTRVPQANIPANLSGEYGTTGLYGVVGDITWYSTNMGRVYKSIDRGHHWSVSATPITNQQMVISFRDINHGIVKMNVAPYTAYTTSDGGTTWQVLTSTGNFYNNDFCYVPGTTSTYISSGSDYTTPFMGSSYSTDGGLTWTTITDTTQFLSLGFADNRHGWAGAFNTSATVGGMWKYNGNLFVYDSCAGMAAYFSKSVDTVYLNSSGLVNFTDLSSGNHNIWNWTFGDGGTSPNTNPSHTYTTAGTYPVTLTIHYGTCVSTYTENLVVEDSCVGLVALFSKSADTVDLNTSGLVNFTDMSFGNYSNLLWDFGDGSTSGVNDPTHTYTSTGAYDVTLTLTFGTCISTYTETVVVINSSGIEKYADGPSIEIWPNPAKDLLHIASAVPISNIEISNSLGQLAYSGIINAANSEVNISHLLPGIYFIRITTAEGRSVGKFIVTK